MKKKIIFTAIISVLIVAFGAWYYVFIYSKYNHRNVANETAIIVSAVNMAKDYQTNEQAANTKYLDKAVEVFGEIVEVGNSQDGKTTIALKTSDAMTTVFCTLKDSISNIKINQQINIKGICIGFTSDVKIKDAIINK
jgi:tRNA_anti-like